MKPAEIRNMRRALDLSQAQFAEHLGVGIATVQRWEIGSSIPSPMAERLLNEFYSRYTENADEKP